MPAKKISWEKIDPVVHFRYAAKPLKGNKHDGYSIPLKVVDPDTGEETMFVHQAPELYLPFGINEKDVAGKTQYRTVFSFPTVRYDTQSQDWIGKDTYVRYFNWIQSIDDYNKDHVHKNMKTWFPQSKEYKKEILDEFYFCNTWVGDKCLEGEYSPTFTTKLQVRSDAIVTKFFNDAKEECTYDEIADNKGKGLRVIPLLRATGIWIAGKNFGMSYQVIQMLFFRKDRFVGCAIDIGAAADAKSVPSSIGSPYQIDMSGEEDEEEEENTHAPPKKKTRSSRSKKSSSSNSNVAPNFNMQETA